MFWKRKQPAKARLLCAVYLLDEPAASDMLSRVDVPGLTTTLMKVGKGILESASLIDLEAMGLTVDAAWCEAMSSTRDLLSTFEVEVIQERPRVLLLESESSYARHALMLFWNEKPEWNGRKGTVVVAIDRCVTIACLCESLSEIDAAINNACNVHAKLTDDQESERELPELWWHNKNGFEHIPWHAGELRPGPQLTAAQRAR